jgi:hypothetical protein
MKTPPRPRPLSLPPFTRCPRPQPGAQERHPQRLRLFRRARAAALACARTSHRFYWRQRRGQPLSLNLSALQCRCVVSVCASSVPSIISVLCVIKSLLCVTCLHRARRFSSAALVSCFPATTAPCCPSPTPGAPCRPQPQLTKPQNTTPTTRAIPHHRACISLTNSLTRVQRRGACALLWQPAARQSRWFVEARRVRRRRELWARTSWNRAFCRCQHSAVCSAPLRRMLTGRSLAAGGAGSVVVGLSGGGCGCERQPSNRKFSTSSSRGRACSVQARGMSSAAVHSYSISNAVSARQARRF